MPLLTEYRGLIGCDSEKLTRDQVHIYGVLMLMEKGGHELPDEITAQFPYQVIKKRCECHGVQVSPHIIAFLAELSTNPAEAVLWAFTCAHLPQPVTFDVWTAAFGDGVPTKDDYRTKWDQQKRPMDERTGMLMNDNWLDDPAVWPRLAATPG